MNELLNNFHFLRPEWLLLILPALLLVVFLMRGHSRSRQWQTLVSAHLLPYLMDGKSVKASRYPLIALLLLWSLLAFALAGPTWTKLQQPLHRQTSALVIAWDLSPSMLAQDVTPSRLVRSRLKLIDLLRQRKEGLTALIVYSGEAHVVTPLTDDTDTIISLLSGLDPTIMPSQGSNIEMAFEQAYQLFKDGGIAKGDILIFTDGIAPSAQTTLQQLHDDKPHSIAIWGIGTQEGAPIPLANGGFAYSSNGDMVIAHLNDKDLSDTAVKLGGLYIPFTQTEFDLQTLANFVFSRDEDTRKNVNRMFDQWEERGPYLLLILLPFAALAFRRGWLLSGFGVVLFLSPIPKAEAFEWQDLWQTLDQQAKKLLAETPEDAAKRFNNPEWKAVANYNAGNYQEALAGFSGENNRNLYNSANALTQLGDYEEAIKQYKQALQQTPADESIQHNLAIAEKLKKLQEQSEQQSDQNKDENSENSGEQNQQQNAGDSKENPQSQQQDNQQQSQNQQKNSDSDKNQNNSQQTNEEQKGNEQQQTENQQQELSEQQKQALEQTYGDKEQEKDNAKQDKSSTTEQQKKHPLEQQENKTEEDGSADDQPHNSSIIPPTAEQQEKQEAQQSLEQWLRKVPDDPSGLLRNKFRYEYGQRRRSIRDNQWKLPEGEQNEERW
ncbi:vWA domain-containing protein [Teredinibacter haidensis]|uniref:vWA domain-containing protein n=1 Tax=Teredinibacter haidensis TaxID=2731755 RepID=UPI000948E743|nr:VWA domain-containing protein [Teredinibacter haidensis]